jgi:hypothetical protein
MSDGMIETLALVRLRSPGSSPRAVSSTNRGESMIEIVRYKRRDAKRRQKRHPAT